MDKFDEIVHDNFTDYGQGKTDREESRDTMRALVLAIFMVPLLYVLIGAAAWAIFH
jgi:hypothetical protein